MASVLPNLLIRGTTGVKLFKADKNYSGLLEVINDSNAKSRVAKFSNDGKYIAYCDGQNLKVTQTDTAKNVFEVPMQKTTELWFSPLNTYIACWEPFYTTPQNPKGSHNSQIFNIQTREVVRSVIYKNQASWMPVWTADEKVSGRCVSNEVQFFEDNDFRMAKNKLYLPKVAGFAFSPAVGLPYIVSVYVLGKKGLPSFVRLFKYPHFGEGEAIANKSFFKADKVDMVWNKQGNALLVLASAETDTTGSSYYGETSLHFMSTKGDSNLVHLEKRGPIYEIDWSPDSSMFCVVYGFMPAKATLFNMKCDAVFDYGTGPRNICKFNPQGNILCLAGFGNLNGIMEMWNIKEKKLISKAQARDTTYFEWCPDGQHLVTSTLSPRLRVSNGFQIRHFSGKQLYAYPMQAPAMPASAELFQTTWQLCCDGKFPAPKLSGVVGVQEAQKEAYRPPSARGTPSKRLVLHEEELPENQRRSENLSANALKNKKKREAKAKAKLQSTEIQYQPQVQKTAQLSKCEENQDTSKKIRALEKKIRQIEELKQKQTEGKVLEINQLNKLKGEDDLRKELASLKLQ